MDLYTLRTAMGQNVKKLMQVQAITGVAGSFSTQPANCHWSGLHVGEASSGGITLIEWKCEQSLRLLAVFHNYQQVTAGVVYM